ncbi:MAG: group 1 glycosyl transferase [Thaumarchaeota archaeon]|nr:group 1 glycosyl transferase [Nitrososphaerota archaeon]
MFKLAYVSTYPPTHCGIAEYTRFLIRALKPLCPELEIYVLSDIGEGGSEVRLEGDTEVHPSFIRGGSDDYSGILDAISEIGGLDILHVQHEYGIYGYDDKILKACLEAKKENLVKKVVFTLHTVHHPLSRNSEALVFQRELNQADALVVHSYLMEFELQNQGINPMIIRRIPHGTLLNPHLDETREELLRSLRLRENEVSGIILTTPGFLRRDKGLDLLINAINSLESFREAFTLLIAGEKRIGGDPEAKKMIKVVEEASRKLNIIFLDRYLSDDEILRVAALSDIIILPYKDVIGKYSVSGILHLSMGSFKPIIGTRVPRLLELYQFSPRTTVTPMNPADLAKIIKWCIRNYDYVVAYMSTLYGYAVRTQWIRMARRHLSLYRELLTS